MRLVLILLIALIFPFLTSSSNASTKTSSVPIVDGFDFPVAKPDATGYYKSRGWSTRHPGEDWVGYSRGTPNRLLGAPVYTIGAGKVVFARNASGGWGNVVIIRHAYQENGKLCFIDSFYAHLQRVLVREGQTVTRGKEVGAIGTNRGMYSPHLHFEIRKNLSIGTHRLSYARNLDNYYVPTAFIKAHRRLKKHGRHVKMLTKLFALQNTFSLPTDESRKYRASKRKMKSEL